jgi:hypothetical protein
MFIPAKKAMSIARRQSTLLPMHGFREFFPVNTVRTAFSPFLNSFARKPDRFPLKTPGAASRARHSQNTYFSKSGLFPIMFGIVLHFSSPVA